jgi:hypothetical protein
VTVIVTVTGSRDRDPITSVCGQVDHQAALLAQAARIRGAIELLRVEQRAVVLSNIQPTHQSNLDMNQLPSTFNLWLSSQPWTNFLQPVLAAYNNTKHSATGVAPNDVSSKNETQIAMTLRSKARTGIYPDVNEGDNVRLRAVH